MLPQELEFTLVAMGHRTSLQSWPGARSRDLEGASLAIGTKVHRNLDIQSLEPRKFRRTLVSAPSSRDLVKTTYGRSPDRCTVGRRDDLQ